MLLGSFFVLLGLLGYGALALCDAKNPPGSAVGIYYPARTNNSLLFMEGGDVQITYSPPSAGTKSGVVRIANANPAPRWVFLRDQDTGTYMRFAIDGSKECKTNIALLHMEGAIIWTDLR